MVQTSVRCFCEHHRRRLEHIASFEVHLAKPAESWKNVRRHQINSKWKRAYERVVQPLRNFMAQRLHVQDYVSAECAGFGVCGVDPRLGSRNRRPLRIVEAQYAARGESTIVRQKHVVSHENGQHVGRVGWEQTGEHSPLEVRIRQHSNKAVLQRERIAFARWYRDSYCGRNRRSSQQHVIILAESWEVPKLAALHGVSILSRAEI